MQWKEFKLIFFCCCCLYPERRKYSWFVRKQLKPVYGMCHQYIMFLLKIKREKMHHLVIKCRIITVNSIVFNVKSLSYTKIHTHTHTHTYCRSFLMYLWKPKEKKKKIILHIWTSLAIRMILVSNFLWRERIIRFAQIHIFMFAVTGTAYTILMLQYYLKRTKM